ncbi:MAG: hypothetical protein OIF35_03430, partial [Cellvibrionaceae bacterium]|nr:hypothetical protein [Cellvibrionaceae bacterium]
AFSAGRESMYDCFGAGSCGQCELVGLACCVDLGGAGLRQASGHQSSEEISNHDSSHATVGFL